MDYQRKIYDHLLQNDLIMRTTRAATAAPSLLNLVAVSVGRDVLTLVALVIVMVTQDPLLSMIVLIIGP